MKTFLFVMSEFPHHGVHVQEQLDVILTVAAFDQKVSLLLLDDGVFQILKDQRPEPSAQKDTAAIYRALQIYDVQDIYVELESLQHRGLKPGDLLLPVRELYRKDVADLMRQFDIVMGG